MVLGCLLSKRSSNVDLVKDMQVSTKKAMHDIDLAV